MQSPGSNDQVIVYGVKVQVWSTSLGQLSYSFKL